LEHYNFVF